MTPRKTIATFGPSGQSIRVFVEKGGELVRVQWRDNGRVHTKSWPNTRIGQNDAKAWARGFAETRDLPAPEIPRLTLRELWERYQAAEFTHLRPRTKTLYIEQWRQFELFAGRLQEADCITAEFLDDYRGALTKRGLSIGAQQKHIATVKMVFAWGLRRELIARDRVSLYRFKVAKEDRPEGVPEYSQDEYERLVGQFSPRTASQWRAWSLTVLLGELGPRINAALHLRWEDVDFEAGRYGEVTWRAKYDKVGNERTQPLTAAAREALFVALGWARQDVRRSGWVYYASRTDNTRETYIVQAFTWMLRAAEDRASIPHRKWRGAHSLRRMSAGNALELSGNIVDAMHWIGDTDLKQAKKYLKKRMDRLEEIARKRSEQTQKPDIQTVTKPQSGPKTTNAPEQAEALSDATTGGYDVE